MPEWPAVPGRAFESWSAGSSLNRGPASSPPGSVSRCFGALVEPALGLELPFRDEAESVDLVAWNDGRGESVIRSENLMARLAFWCSLTRRRSVVDWAGVTYGVESAVNGLSTESVARVSEGSEESVREIDNDPGADGVTNRANDAIARKRPRAGRVIEKSGRSWQHPSYT